uniref:Non-specific lipid-transfer protein 2 n=1 Tax=Noccaea caerulescens TaxID=107243 RepID=A0A1J3CNX3_NOCCA
MMGCSTKPVLFTCAILLFFVVAQEHIVAAAVAPCDPMQLLPCEDAIRRGSAPTKECCTKVGQQQHCVCGYLRNPNFKAFLNSPNAKKIATDCHYPYPKC